ASSNANATSGSALPAAHAERARQRRVANRRMAIPRSRNTGGAYARASGRARGPLAVHLGAQLLAQADLPGRDLDQFVVVDELQRLLERDLDRRHQALVVVLAGSAEVGQLLGAQGVDREVVVLAVDADDLAFLDLLAR